MTSRGVTRVRTLGRAAFGALGGRANARPEYPATILVLHELQLGDTLMLAPLFAALRARYPAATIYASARPEVMPLFAARPYGVEPLPFTERDSDALRGLEPAKDCELAIIPGENRYALTARALGAQWIVALAGARPAWKDWAADELIGFPDRQSALADIFATLAGPHAPLPYRPGDWPAPSCAPYGTPTEPYALLHVGASTPLKYWPAARWRALARRVAEKGYHVVWSAGPKEAELIREVDPEKRHPSYAGTLDLAQLWHLVAKAELLVTLDTGVAHLAKLTGTRTLCLYGPGSAVLAGRGEFWKNAPFAEVTVPEFACRDQRLLFKREIPWVRRCGRSRAECPRPRCMEAITVDDVAAGALDVIGPLIGRSPQIESSHWPR